MMEVLPKQLIPLTINHGNIQILNRYQNSSRFDKMFWGLTPALDLQDELIESDSLDHVNVLLIGNADCRHVLKTLARKYRHRNVQFNFYIIEAILESVAKQLLMIFIAVQVNEDVGLVDKTRTFMDLYGNALIRPRSAKFLKGLSIEMIKMITDRDYLEKMLPFVTVDLRFKERDYLENVFKFWGSKDRFDICTFWDARLRKDLGVRYDAKDGVFDWDLHMRLYQIGANQICNQEYKHWRATGVAFTWIESEVSMVNRTLVSGVVPLGEKFAHFGYLGDTSTGPFVTYGLECEDEKFLKKSQGRNAYRSTDITERNLMQLFHELETNTSYEHINTGDMELGNATFLLSELKVVDSGNIDGVTHRKVKCFNIKDVNVNFISINALKLMQHQEKWRKFFKLVYCASNYLKYLDVETLQKICTSHATFLVENPKFVVSNRNEDLVANEKNVREFFKDFKSKIDLPFDFKKDAYMKWIVNSE